MIDNEATEEFTKENRTLDSKIRMVCTTREEYYQTRGVMVILQQNTWENIGQCDYETGIETFKKYLRKPKQPEPLSPQVLSTMQPRQRTAYQIVKDWATILPTFTYNHGRNLRNTIHTQEQKTNTVDTTIENSTPTRIIENSYLTLHPISGSIDRIGGLIIGTSFMIPAFIIGLLTTTPKEYKKIR